MSIELYKELPGYLKLNDEQRKTADRWDEERSRQDRLINQLDQAMKSGDEKLYQETLAGLASPDSHSYMCEHERHWSSNCAGCDEIERILRPELYCHNEDCGYSLEMEEVESGQTLCEYCREEEDEETT